MYTEFRRVSLGSFPRLFRLHQSTSLHGPSQHSQTGGAGFQAIAVWNSATDPARRAPDCWAATRRCRRRRAAARSNSTTGMITPAFSIVHGYSQNHVAGEEWAEANGRPATLIVKVELPEVATAAEVELDVQSDTLELSTAGGSKYCLSVQLPYTVDCTDGASTAKFDIATRLMAITMPVLPGGAKRKTTDSAPSVRAASPACARAEFKCLHPPSRDANDELFKNTPFTRHN